MLIATQHYINIVNDVARYHDHKCWNLPKVSDEICSIHKQCNFVNANLGSKIYNNNYLT